MRRYRDLSKRDPATITNTKGYFISRRAQAETPKADRAKIERELGSFVSVMRQGRRGKMVKRREVVLAKGQSGAPLAALIVNARRRDRGLPALQGPEMAKEVRKLLASRFRSIAFLKAGWIPAIRTLSVVAEKRGAPRGDMSARQIGGPKGYAIPAHVGWKVSTIIANTAVAKGDTGEALIRYGGPALQRAFDAETRSMKQYIERKMKSTAIRAGVKVR